MQHMEAGSTPRREHAQNREFDAIVIGSGIGGLTTASLLAQIEGLRVLVLEKHFEIGGFTHAFRRKGYSFDVGLHYVGQMQSGSFSRRIMDAVTRGQVSWNPMPKVYDRFRYPFGEFAASADPEVYRQDLTAAFPAEGPAIRRYFEDIDRAAKWMQRDATARFLPGPAGSLTRASALRSRKLALETTRGYMDTRFRNEQLKRVLCSQWGDYGVPPDRSSFGIHALIVRHYLHGAFYPEGGAEGIARSVEEILEARGGRVLFQSEALRIVTDGKRATGVQVRHQPGGEVIEYHAPIVISDAGARQTFGELVSTELPGRSGRRLRRLRSLAAAQDTGNSAVILFLGFDRDPRELGVEGENFWIFGDRDHQEFSAHTRELLEGRPQAAYLSFPSIKAGDDRPHSAEVISLVDPDVFSQWMDAPWGDRGGDYLAVKERIAEGLLAVAESAVPGIRDMTVYRELATPATIRSFTSRTAGRMYGLATTPERYGSSEIHARTPLTGLYLTGSDIVSPGIVGAAVGGVGAAASVLGPQRVFPYLYNPRARRTQEAGDSPLRRGSGAATPSGPIANDRMPARLVAREEVAPNIYELRFRISRSPVIRPGQYARVEVEYLVWRDYSIADFQALADGGTELLFVIDARFDGPGSRFARSILPGESRVMRLPAGEFTVAESGRPKVFVATGTGITPLVAMIRRGLSGGDVADRPPARLVFGCRTAKEDLSARYLAGEIPTEVCLSRESTVPQADAAGRRYRPGYVTDALREALAAGDSDFYICGNPDMVGDVETLLYAQGANRVFTERY